MVESVDFDPNMWIEGIDAGDDEGLDAKFDPTEGMNGPSDSSEEDDDLFDFLPSRRNTHQVSRSSKMTEESDFSGDCLKDVNER